MGLSTRGTSVRDYAGNNVQLFRGGEKVEQQLATLTWLRLIDMCPQPLFAVTDVEANNPRKRIASCSNRGVEPSFFSRLALPARMTACHMGGSVSMAQP